MEKQNTIIETNKINKYILYFPTGRCDHNGILSLSEPVLVKLNWRGLDFKAGSWGKDFALGTQLQNVYWVFPMNKDERTLETFRIYPSLYTLLIYSPSQEYSLNVTHQSTCEDCGQGGGVILFNSSFYYNCFDSRALCKTDPFTIRITRKEFPEGDPASFNNMFSYKGVKYQDMDMAGDEKGLWMVHGSTLANGNMVIRKIDPDTLDIIGSPWTTGHPKEMVTNTFMICGVLYGTKRINSTQEEIFYQYDTNTGIEGNLQIFIKKPSPTVQSLNYNPNDQKLYMFNDGFLVSYNLTFKNPPKAGQAPVGQQEQASDHDQRQIL